MAVHLCPRCRNDYSIGLEPACRSCLDADPELAVPTVIRPHAVVHEPAPTLRPADPWHPYYVKAIQAERAEYLPGSLPLSGRRSDWSSRVQAYLLLAFASGAILGGLVASII